MKYGRSVCLVYSENSNQLNLLFQLENCTLHTFVNQMHTHTHRAHTTIHTLALTIIISLLHLFVCCHLSFFRTFSFPLSIFLDRFYHNHSPLSPLFISHTHFLAHSLSLTHTYSLHFSFSFCLHFSFSFCLHFSFFLSL